MKLELWNPLFELDRDRDSFWRFPRLLDDDEFRPSIDVTRTDGHLMVVAEIPGIDPTDDVEITVDDDFLTIKGEKSEEAATKDESRIVQERRYGSFMRRIPIPDGVTAEDVVAKYDGGVLTVTVPLPEEAAPAEPRKVKVEV
jgi:HSP20 family protein